MQCGTVNYWVGIQVLGRRTLSPELHLLHWQCGSGHKLLCWEKRHYKVAAFLLTHSPENVHKTPASQGISSLTLFRSDLGVSGETERRGKVFPASLQFDKSGSWRYSKIPKYIRSKDITSAVAQQPVLDKSVRGNRCFIGKSSCMCAQGTLRL